MEPYALIVGESLIDIVTTPDGLSVERPGGSAANTAVALARLGRPVVLASSWGLDDRGRALESHLAGNAIDLAMDPRILARTSSARATIHADGSASYAFDLDWQLPPMPAQDPYLLHVCSLGVVVEPGCHDVHALVEGLHESTWVTYDINVRPAVTGTGPEVLERIERMAAMSDLVKVSDEDLAAIYPDLRVEDAALHLLELGPNAVALTRGDAGATWIELEYEVDMPAVPTVVVDTIGAGDTFSAALIDALWDEPDRDPAESMAYAARAAAVTVSRPGADPPYRAELD